MEMYARARYNYLKEHQRSYYSELRTNGTLEEHLKETQERALNMEERLIAQMAKEQGVTEKLKAENQMEWVRRMNNIIQAAREIVMNEVI